VEVLWEEASVVILKLPKLKVLKSLIAIDRELRGKVLWEKVSVEELKLPKSKALKPEVSKW